MLNVIGVKTHTKIKGSITFNFNGIQYKRNTPVDPKQCVLILKVIWSESIVYQEKILSEMAKDKTILKREIITCILGFIKYSDVKERLYIMHILDKYLRNKNSYNYAFLILCIYPRKETTFIEWSAENVEKLKRKTA
jgi:hypothetical protein